MRGFDGASLRDIAKTANVAQPTINYHFETKANLFAAVIQRGATLSCEKRIARLTDERARDDRLSLERIALILFEPYNLPEDQVPEQERFFNKFIGQFGYGSSPEAQAITLAAFDTMAQHFIDAILGSEEGFDRVTATKAYLYALPTGIYAVDHQRRLAKLSGAPQDPRAQFSFEEVITFVCQGMRTLIDAKS